ncbi:MAG: hypothetical protein WAN36_13285 [Calditrichia bacterium]
MKQVVIAGILGGIVVFVWGFISWVVLPWHNYSMQTLPQEERLVGEMRGLQLETGVYFFPGMAESSDEENARKNEEVWAENHRQGPIGMIFYHREGTEPMSPGVFILGILIAIIAAGVAAALLKISVNQISSYGKRVAFVAMIGLFSVIAVPIYNWNWLYIPATYTIIAVLDLFITWVLAGLVIAWRVKPTMPISKATL